MATSSSIAVVQGRESHGSLGFIGLLTVLLSVSTAMACYGQVTDEASDVESASLSFGLDTEVGLLSFENEYGDGERFLSSVLAPSVTWGLWSGGLRLRYRWNEHGMRDEDYDETADYLAILRFIQYSDKDEPGFYGRIGDIDRAQLGYGQFVNGFRNTLSLDEPETGLLLDHLGTQFQFEGLFSNFASSEVYGARMAYKPFLMDSSRSISAMSFGITLAGDLSDDARLVNRYRNGLPFFEGDVATGADTLGLGSAEEQSPLTMVGFDVSMPIPTSKVDELEAYVELGNIFGFGSGLGVGFEAVHQYEKIRVKAWFEQRLLGPEYVPSYFNSRYETDRIRSTTVTLADGTELDALNTKRNELYRRDETELGSYVGMELRFTRHYRLRWSLEHAWTRENSGWFEFDFRVTDPTLPLQIRYVYDRVNMNGVADVVDAASNDALHRLELAYLFKKHFLLGFRFQQSFETIENLGRNIGHSKRSRIEPAIIIRI